MIRMVKAMKRSGHHYRIANPVRFFIFILICTLMIMFAGYSILGAGHADAAAVRTYAQVTINDGDNLWSIVEQYNPDSNINVQNAIYDIYEINDITADDLQPGDKIFVPIY